MRVENLNIDILRQLAHRAEENILAKFPAFEDWLAGVKSPTVKQLSNFAKALNVPFGYFFLKSLPEKAFPIPHYRTKAQGAFMPSASLRASIEIIQKRQDWAVDLLQELGQEKLWFANSITTETPISKAVDLLYEVLNLNQEWARSLPTWSAALNLLIDKSEAAGIFVVVNGVIGNNTHSSLDVDEFRGFVLYNDVAPFVFVNGKDAISGKVFTLVHELVHVLLGQSASFDLNHLQPADNAVEEYCNAVTAEFLVPEQELRQHLQEGIEDYQQLARRFKVSQLVIARRMLDLKMINKSTFFAFYDDYIQREHSKNKGPGGDFYNTAPYRVSRRFFELIHNAVKANRLLYTEAFSLTGLKAKTYDNYVEKKL